MASHLVVASASLKGRRGRNEDRVLARILPGEQDTAMIAVADGMGGHEAGDVAAELAIRNLTRLIKKRGFDTRSPETSHREIYADINKRILKTARRVDRMGMGTTLVSVLLRDGRVAIAHVGDSRAYRLDEREMVCLTEDHSVVQDAVRRGIAQANEAASAGFSHALTQAMGTDEEVSPDFRLEEVPSPSEPGHVYLVCSDGLWGALESPAIEQIVRRTATVEEAANALVGAALGAGSEDNISAALLEIGPFPRSPVPLELETGTELGATIRYRPKDHRRWFKRAGMGVGASILLALILTVAWIGISEPTEVPAEDAAPQESPPLPGPTEPVEGPVEGPRVLWVEVEENAREILLSGSVSLGRAEPGQPLQISAYPGDTLRARAMPGLRLAEVVWVVDAVGPDTIRLGSGQQPGTLSGRLPRARDPGGAE